MEEAFDRLKNKLNQAAAAALREEDFERVQKIMEAAKALKVLRDRFANLVGGEPSTKERRAERISQTNEETSQKTVITSEPEGQTNDYPKFFVRDDALIRRGLRSDKTTTYEQRLSRTNFDQVIEVLRSVLAAKTEFHPSEVVSKANTPQYHIYMTLHVLENAGFLDLIRRGLYRFLRTTESSWADGVWGDIPRGH